MKWLLENVIHKHIEIESRRFIQINFCPRLLWIDEQLIFKIM